MSLFNVTELGVITVDTSAIKSDLEAAYKSALGAELNTDTDTPQGQLIQNDTNNLVYVMDEVTKVANMFSVYYATGASLDTAAAYFGYYRKYGVHTVVVGTLGGIQGTVIPQGSVVSNGSYDFVSLYPVTIGATGTVDVEFQCVESGAIPCLAGTLTTIVTDIPDWDTVTNASDGVKGFETESDNEFRNRITANWLNIRGKTILGATIDNIAQLNGVISVVGRENPSTQTQVIDGITMVAHSIFICAYGGSDEEIAKVLGLNKTVGAATNGDYIASFYDADVGYTYVYKIQRPTVLDLAVQIEYEENQYTPADVQTRISDTVLAWIAENPFKIGQTISGNMLAESLAGFNFINLLSFKVKLATDVSYSDYLTLSLEEIGVLNAANINYVVS